MKNKIINTYFLVLFSIIPISIITGSAVSVVNILLIDLSFIFLIIYKKEFKFLSNTNVKWIIFLCLYLVFNSFISRDLSIGALRNFGFIRFGIMFIAFNYFFYDKSFLNKVLMIWTIIILGVVVDVYIESFTGRNILGYGEVYGGRIVSFFKDEPVVGGYLNAFYLIIIGYFFNRSSKYKNIFFIISMLIFLSILLTGERSNGIKACLGVFLFYIYNDTFKLKHKIQSLFLIVLLMVILINSSDYLKLRFGSQLISPIISQFQLNKNLEYDIVGNANFKNSGIKVDQGKIVKGNLYYRLYNSGFSVFKDNPIFGVGNKNYRFVTCAQSKNKSVVYFCSTHPHQIYFEFLSEHGLFGTMILLSIFFYLIFSKIKIILDSKNFVQIGCLIFLFTTFIPLLPSGAFFGDYNLTIFWVNLSVMYAVGKKTNIYK